MTLFMTLIQTKKDHSWSKSVFSQFILQVSIFFFLVSLAHNLPKMYRKVIVAYSYTILLCFIFLVLGGLVFILEYVEVLCWKISAYNQRYRIQKEAFWSILKQDIAWFDTSSTGEMNTRLSEYVYSLTWHFTTIWSALILNLIINWD